MLCYSPSLSKARQAIAARNFSSPAASPTGHDSVDSSAQIEHTEMTDRDIQGPPSSVSNHTLPNTITPANVLTWDEISVDVANAAACCGSRKPRGVLRDVSGFAGYAQFLFSPYIWPTHCSHVFS